jgi:hypothetical protein
MHGEMYANAAAPPHSVTAPITFKFVQSVADTNRPFQFQKRSQLFVGADVFAQPKVQPRFLR